MGNIIGILLFICIFIFSFRPILKIVFRDKETEHIPFFCSFCELASECHKKSCDDVEDQ